MLKNVKRKTLLTVGLLLLSSSFVHGESYTYNVSKYKTSRYTSNRYNIKYDFYDRQTNNNYNYNWQFITMPYKNYGKVKKTPIEPEQKPTMPEAEQKPEIENNNLSTMEIEVVRLVNIERKKAGLAPFTISSELSSVARTKSKDMAINKYFSHNSPTYGSPFEMMKKFNIKYNTAGENIAKGYLSAQSVVNGWMNSSGHRANILNGSFNKIGVGAYTDNNSTIYWTQMFTN